MVNQQKCNRAEGITLDNASGDPEKALRTVPGFKGKNNPVMANLSEKGDANIIKVRTDRTYDVGILNLIKGLG